MGANLPRLLQDERYPKFHRDPTPKRAWAGLAARCWEDYRVKAPRRRCIANPSLLPICLPCPEFRRHQQHPSSMRFMSHHVLYYYRGEGTQASGASDPCGASGACGDRGACGGRKRTTALISHDSEPGPAPVRENRIQFPTHRPDVQDAQCCVQVGRFLTFFPTPGFPGHQTGYFCCDCYCSYMPRVIGTLGRVGEGRGRGVISGAEHVGKQVILPFEISAGQGEGKQA